MPFQTSGLTTVTLATMACAMALPPAQAEMNFEGKNLTAIIASRAPSGTDTMARLAGKLMESYLPGNPQMVYRNMPAGSGIRATNYFVEEVAPDGMTWMSASSSTIRPERLRKKTVRYDPRKLAMFGGLPAPSAPILVRKDALDRLNDPSKPPVIMSGITGNRGSSQMAVWGPEYLGWNMRWVIGYSGSGAMRMAIERNETQAFVTYNKFVLDPLMESGNYKAIAQVGMWESGTFVPRSDFPDTPIMSEMVKPKLSGIALEAFEAWETMVQVGKWFALPPGTPDDIVKTYESAYLKAVKSDAFRKEAAKVWSPDYTVSNAAETHEVAAKNAQITDASLEFLDSLKRKVGIPPQIPGVRRLLTTLTAVKGGEIEFKRRKKTVVSPLDKETRISIDGKDAKAGDLETGMRCEVLYPKKGAATAVSC